MRRLDRMQEERLAEEHAKSFKPLTAIEAFILCLAIAAGVLLIIVVGEFL